MEYLTAKAPEGSVARFIARNISLDKVALPSEQFGLSNIKLTNLSDAPVALGKPIGIEIKSVEGEKAMDMEIDFQSDGTGNVTGNFANLDLAVLQSQMNSDNAMLIDKGMATGKFAGTISKDFIDITIDLETQTVQLPDGRKVHFSIDNFSKTCILDGIDQLGYLQSHASAVEAYEATHPNRVNTLAP